MEIQVLHGPLKGLQARVLASRQVEIAPGTNEPGKRLFLASREVYIGKIYTVLDIVSTTKAENSNGTIMLKDARELR